MYNSSAINIQLYDRKTGKVVQGVTIPQKKVSQIKANQHFVCLYIQIGEKILLYGYRGLFGYDPAAVKAEKQVKQSKK